MKVKDKHKKKSTTEPESPPAPHFADPTTPASSPFITGTKSESTDSSSSSLLSNKKALGVAVVVLSVLVLGFFYLRSPSSSTKTQEEQSNGRGKRVRWADNEGMELEESDEDYELSRRQEEAFLAQEQKMEAGRNIEEILNRIDGVKSEIAKNEGETKNAKNNMNNMFGDEKAGYDSVLSSMETEQSFDTAFMMKSQLDDKRQGMMEYSKQLGSQLEELMKVGQQLGQTYERMQQEYQSNYGTVYIPQRAIMAKKQMEEQQKHQAMMAAQQQQQQMANRAPAPPPGFEHYAQQNGMHQNQQLPRPQGPVSSPPQISAM